MPAEMLSRTPLAMFADVDDIEIDDRAPRPAAIPTGVQME